MDRVCAVRWFSLLVASVALAGCGAHRDLSPGAPLVPHARVTQRPLGTATTTDAYASAVLASGPAAYYRLDDTGTIAADLSANALNGTIGAGVTKNVAGLVASSGDTAMVFPGTANGAGIVAVPPTTLLQPQSHLSIEAFLKFGATPPTYAVPIAYGSDLVFAPYDLYFQNGRLLAQFDLSSGVLVVASPAALATNTTYHVVATFDGATGSLYLNGTLVASVAKSGTIAAYDGTHGLAIGDDAGYSDPGFAGTVDEVAIYAKTLAASDVAAHYAAAVSGATPTPTPTSTPAPIPSPTATPTPAGTPPPTDAYANAVLASNPVAYYRLDGTTTTVLDRTTNHLNGAAGTSVALGVPGLVATSTDAAMGFPGIRSTAGTVVVPPSALLRPTSAVSLEAFLRFSATPATYAVPVAYGSDFYYAPYDLYFQNGKLNAQFFLNAGPLVVTSPNALQAGVTYDVVATFDGSTGRLYLNGALVASAAKAGTLAGYDTTHGLAIGDDAGFSDPAFAGTVDEVAIYARALAASDVSAHAAAAGTATATPPPTPPPAAYVDWPTFAYDRARTGNASAETTLGVGNAGSLQLLWTHSFAGVLSAQPVLAVGVATSAGTRNVVYVGSHDGTFAALDAETGTTVWQKTLGSTSYACGGSTQRTGVDRSAAIDRTSNRVYVEDGQLRVHALDLGTGAEAAGWPVAAGGTLGSDFPHGAMNLDAANRMLYVSSAATCDASPWHGRVAAIDTQAAALEATFFTIPGGSGGGVWGQGGASIDPQSGNVFAAVGNADLTVQGPQNAGYGETVLALSPALGFVAANYPGVPPYNLLPGSTPQGTDGDLDFGATPVLFTGPDGSACAAAMNKSGILVLYARANVAGGYTQYVAMNPPTDDADFVGSPAYSPATTLLYVPLPNDFASGTATYAHGLAALHVNAGCTVNATPAWNATFGILPSATTLDDPHSPPTVANGVVYVGDGPGATVYAFNALTGAPLWSAHDASGGVYAPPLVDGHLYVATYGGVLDAYAAGASAASRAVLPLGRARVDVGSAGSARLPPPLPRRSTLRHPFGR